MNEYQTLTESAPVVLVEFFCNLVPSLPAYDADCGRC